MHVIELCNRTVKGTVDMSCLCEWTECIMCTCCFLHFAKLTVAVFFYENVYPMSNFFLKVCHSFD